MGGNKIMKVEKRIEEKVFCESHQEIEKWKSDMMKAVKKALKITLQDKQ